MTGMQELIEQNLISSAAASFLVACVHANLKTVIWSSSRDDALMLAKALSEAVPVEHHHFIATFVSPAPHGVRGAVSAQVLVHLIDKRVQAIIDISTEIETPIFELDRQSDNAELQPTGLRPPIIAKINDANIQLPPSVFPLAPPQPEPASEVETSDNDELIKLWDDLSAQTNTGSTAVGQTQALRVLSAIHKELIKRGFRPDDGVWSKDDDEDWDSEPELPKAEEKEAQAPPPPPMPPQPAPGGLGANREFRDEQDKPAKRRRDSKSGTDSELTEQRAEYGGGAEENITRSGSTSGSFMEMLSTLDENQRKQFAAKLQSIPTEKQSPDVIKALYDEITGGSQIKEAQFTAYYARQTAANTEYGFYVYAHLPEALISADVQQFAQDLGGRVPKPTTATESIELDEGAMLTVMLHCDALEFNQIGIMKKWEAPFVRFDFRYTAPESLVDEFVEGRVAIMLGMIEIASIDFQTLVTAPLELNLIDTLPDNPLQQGIFEPSNPANMYQKIFISYSRKDTLVAEEFRKAQIMMGNIVFMDTHSIRAGEAWEEALKRFIREADVFQLFWSEHSAASEHCRFEWEYALNHHCNQTRCIGFIRPAYWQKPLPNPPAELRHLHFAYVPQEGVLT